MKRSLFIFAVCGSIAALALWAFRASPSPEPKPEPVATQAIPDLSKPESIKAAVEVPKPHQPDRRYVPPAVRDKNLQTLVNRHAENRLSGDISARIPEASPEDFPALLKVLQDPEDDDTVRNEVANLLRRSKCPGLPQALLQVLDNPAEQPRFRSFAMQHLGGVFSDMDDDARQPFLARIQAALADKHYQVRSQALQNLLRQKDPQAGRTAAKWLTDYPPAPPVLNPGGTPPNPEAERGTLVKQAIECVQALDLKEYIPSVRKLAHDANPVVAIAAIVALANWRDAASLPVMQAAAQSKDPRLQACAQAALERMKGKVQPHRMQHVIRRNFNDMARMFYVEKN
jgi:HEAT repeat protein